MRATSGRIEWTLVSRAPLRVQVPGLAVHHWRTAEELRDLLAQPWALESPLWLATQQLDCEWLPPFVSLCRGMQKHIRLVVDVRDMTSLIPKPTVSPLGGNARIEAISLDELSTFRAADGVIHISGEIATAAELLHRNLSSIPTYILPCFTNTSEALTMPAGRGLVYAGGVAPPSPTFRNYCDLFQLLAEAGHEVHVYASPTNAYPQATQDSYTVRGCQVHPRVPDHELIGYLALHRWGIVGFPNGFPLGNGALPNKLFEYFSAGLPVLVFNADAAGAFVAERGLGLWVRTQREFEVLPEYLDKTHERMRENVLEQRPEFTMDARAEGLCDFFRRVLKNKPVKLGGVRIALESTTIVDPIGGDTNLLELFA